MARGTCVLGQGVWGQPQPPRSSMEEAQWPGHQLGAPQGAEVAPCLLYSAAFSKEGTAECNSSPCPDPSLATSSFQWGVLAARVDEQRGAGETLEVRVPSCAHTFAGLCLWPL